MLVRDVAHELGDIDAAIAEHTPVPIGLRDRSLDRDDAFETRLEVARAFGGGIRLRQCASAVVNMFAAVMAVN